MPLSRKQREIREREALILEIGKSLIQREGYFGITMDKVAREVEYSKGTVYQHFGSKEDLLLALALEGRRRLASLFERASTFRGKSRERMVAIGMAYELYSRLEPESILIESLVASPDIRGKCDPQRQSELDASESKIFHLCTGVVRDGMAHGDLESESADPTAIGFGLWSLTFGAYTLMQSSPSIDELGQRDDLFEAVRTNCHHFMDGLGWNPLRADWDYDATYERIRTEVFSDECRPSS